MVSNSKKISRNNSSADSSLPAYGRVFSSNVVIFVFVFWISESTFPMVNYVDEDDVYLGLYYRIL